MVISSPNVNRWGVFGSFPKIEARICTGKSEITGHGGGRHTSRSFEETWIDILRAKKKKMDWTGYAGGRSKREGGEG